MIHAPHQARSKPSIVINPQTPQHHLTSSQQDGKNPTSVFTCTVSIAGFGNQGPDRHAPQHLMHLNLKRGESAGAELENWARALGTTELN